MSDEQTSGTVKKFLYINRRAPHGSNYAQEGLEVALIGAAFDQDVAMAYLDDGVFQLRKGQDTSEIGTKNFSPTYRALGDFEVQKVYVEKESLARRGMTEDDLLELVYEDEDDDWEEKPLIKLVNESEMRDIIEDADVVMNF
jgi:tRNA 2-thiouridine synthesizing protein C